MFYYGLPYFFSHYEIDYMASSMIFSFLSLIQSYPLQTFKKTCVSLTCLLEHEVEEEERLLEGRQLCNTQFKAVWQITYWQGAQSLMNK
jgi:hypothetical protein